MTLLKPLFKPAFWAAVAVVAWTTLAPSDMLPKVLFTWWDKAEHALAFAVLSFLGCVAYPRQRTLVLAAMLAYGGAIEVAQHVSGWRIGDIVDWMADNTGVVIGGVAAHFATASMNTPTAPSTGRR